MESSVAIQGIRAGAAILGRIIRPGDPTLIPEAALSILKPSFAREDQDRVAKLLEENQMGKLSPAEREEIEEFLRVDTFLSLLQSKARLSLKQAGLEP